MITLGRTKKNRSTATVTYEFRKCPNTAESVTVTVTMSVTEQGFAV